MIILNITKEDFVLTLLSLLSIAGLATLLNIFGPTGLVYVFKFGVLCVSVFIGTVADYIASLPIF